MGGEGVAGAVVGWLERVVVVIVIVIVVCVCGWVVGWLGGWRGCLQRTSTLHG